MYTDNRQWTLVINSGQNTRIRLICFPQAGAAAEQLRVWSNDLADHIELVAINLPGHGPRHDEAPCDTWPSLLQSTFATLEPWLGEPHALFGHGLGALLAYEACKHAQEHFPEQTRHLFVSGCRSPDSLPHRPLLHSLSTDAFHEAILSLGASALEIPRQPGELQAYERVLRSGLKLFETWNDTSSGCLDIPLTAFYGSEDPLATVNHVLNWREFTRREFELIEVAGNHFFIKSQRQRLLQVINTHLGLLGEY
ncbi:thioesterase II family protein [Pseudomonas sp. LD120]|uniref:thioesterase II family protein n=1 Tax=Pseudomonas sp. LD120 TaxID=485751 RepID=UPI001357A8A2|nr:alpha/beta fold hydrolase [Pseudomonas sp. LD120]KAF0861878.1 alpha/beta fold hydrolase [Pseudomonas sp. LD120]